MAEQDLHENPFRDYIYDYFIKNGYEKSLKADFNLKNALDTVKLFGFLEKTQKPEINKLKAYYGDNYENKFIELLAKKIDEVGILSTLKTVIEDYPSNTKVNIMFTKPNMASMTDGIDNYNNNIFSICKEFVYEEKEKPHRVDLALFINGIPMIMIELKKQTAGQKAGFEGTKQFRETRDPSQLIFAFNKRTLAYFAVDELVAFVSTKLDKNETKFIPYNIGDENEGAGNPISKDSSKFPTAYIWEEILKKDNLIRIISEFMFIDEDGNIIFPRYHQRRAVLRCEKDVKDCGIGKRYLIWHSAGSGKTKTIAWLAKRLSVINSINTVIVISDRTVIDGQLGLELVTLDNKKGVVNHIDTSSSDLLDTLEKGGYIIVTTLQKFRPILQEIKRHEDRKYAIIIDEAHSSTAGKSMSKASEMLSGKSLKEVVEIDDAYEEMEDGQNQLIQNANLINSINNISYFAFTATPKKETVELFGTRGAKGKQYFDKYSMKQAIEEKYILNPLTAFVSYKDYYEIRKKKEDSNEYDSKKAQVAILNYVTSSEDVIRDKTNIFMDDFVQKRITWLNGKAKAMVVSPSRTHAVLYALAVRKYIKEHGLNFMCCVAFTGTIEENKIKYTENDMNSMFSKSTDKNKYDLKSIIKSNDDIRIIVVADKLQTGYDEDKLSIMYIDKKLGSEVKAVQTISRINRTLKNKRTFILDFANDTDTIKAYFEKYYGGELFLPTANETDPNILFSKRDNILGYCVVTLQQVDKLYSLITNVNNNPEEIANIISAISKSFNRLEDEKQELFLAQIKKFTKLFYYISLVHNSWNKDMETLAVVFDVIYNVLYKKESTEKIDAETLVELISFNTKKISEELTIDLEAQETEFDGVSTEVSVVDKSYSMIDEIIERFNLHYANAKEEFTGIIDELSVDPDLKINVRDSRSSAYESVVREKVHGSVIKALVDGTISGDTEKAQFYADINSNDQIINNIATIIVKKIKDMLIAG